MEKGNTIFYHQHIKSNIHRLGERRDTFVDNRLGFLSNYYAPVQKKIEEIKQKIRYYQNMRDTQNEVIENDEDVLKLKAQIKQYLATNRYFEGKLDEYDQMTILLQEENKKLKNKIQRIKKTYKKNYLDETQTKTEKSLFASRVGVNKTVPISETNELLSLQKAQSIKLPKIRKPSKYYVFHKHTKQTNHSLHTSLQQSVQQFDASILTENPEEISPKQIRELMAQFDKTETLFRECFERKKFLVQKSVSQLQSKLITNKESFLKACQVIGEKEGNLSYEQFCELTGDQIITLFISFGWLNRKMYSEFTKKRKNITKMISKLPQF